MATREKVEPGRRGKLEKTEQRRFHQFRNGGTTAKVLRPVVDILDHVQVGQNR